MTWTKARHGWLKWYRGRMHAVSCKQLGCEASKEASVQKANEWWAHKQDELDAQGPQHPNHIVAQYSWARRNHTLYADYLTWQRNTSTTPNETPYREEVKSRKHLEWLEAEFQKKSPTFPLTKWQENPLWEDRLDPAKDLMWLERFNGFTRHQIATARQKPKAEKEKTVGKHIAHFLSTKRGQVALGEISAKRLESLTLALHHFRDWFGADRPLPDVQETTLLEYKTALAQEIQAGRTMAQPSRGREPAGPPCPYRALEV